MLHKGLWSLPFICLAMPSTGIAQSVEERETIVVTEGPEAKNSVTVHSIAGTCDGNLFEIRIRSIANSQSELIGITRNQEGAPASETHDLENLLAASGSVYLTSLRCQGDRNIVVGIAGSLLKPAIEQNDDYIRFFLIDFSAEP